MTLETIEKQSTNKIYWIKFQEQNGKILGISKSKPTISDVHYSVIQSDNEDLPTIVKGKANIKDYFVQANLLTNDWQFVKKSKKLELQPVRKKLEQVPLSNNIEENDIYITLYKKSMKAIIAINSKRVMKHQNLAMINDVVANDYSLLNLFVCKKNDPDRLITIIQVDTKSLVLNKKIIVDLPNMLLEHADIDQLSIFVMPVFDKYGINYVDELIETPELVGHQKIINSNSYNQNALINIYTVNDNTLELNHNINESQFNLFGNKNTLKFVVCDQHYDNLVGGFEIYINELLSSNSREVLLNFNVPQNPLFLYKNNNILVSYNGDKHEQHD